MELPHSVLSEVTALLEEQGVVYVYRRELRRISPDQEKTVYVASAEDTILAKLRWYKAGNETSTTQWNDVVGVLGTSLNSLDQEYLRTGPTNSGSQVYFKRP
jgi:hypothetical protein